MGNADSTPEAVAVWQAAKGGDVTKLQALYNEHRSEQPDILSATPTQAGTTPTYEAAAGGHLAVLRLINCTQAKTDVIVASQAGRTPMFAAALNGHVGVMRWLSKRGAASDVSTPDDKGQVPMHAAARQGKVMVCQWLVNNGAAADVSLPDLDGRTPLHIAAARGGLAVTKWLVEHGAKACVAVADNLGCTPAQLAAMNSHNDTVDYLESLAGAPPKRHRGPAQQLHLPTLRAPAGAAVHAEPAAAPSNDAKHSLSLSGIGKTLFAATIMQNTDVAVNTALSSLRAARSTPEIEAALASIHALLAAAHTIGREAMRGLSATSVRAAAHIPRVAHRSAWTPALVAHLDDILATLGKAHDTVMRRRRSLVAGPPSSAAAGGGDGAGGGAGAGAATSVAVVA